MISRLIIAVAIALFFSPVALIVAQEHPEHPKKTTEQPKKGGEHPKQGVEHPKKGEAEKQVSTADISAGIKSSPRKAKRLPTENFTSHTKVRICLSI